MVSSVFTATLVMLGLALLFSELLVLANRRLAVEVDPRQAEIAAALPQANCGGCGYASCAAYAKAVAAGNAPVDLCTVGGPPVAQLVAEAMGVEVTANYPFRPVIHCAATQDQRLKREHYVGEATCAAADVVGGVQGCTYGCLGFGDCVRSCEYDAMTLVDGLPRINYDNCIGCGACVRACPRNIIEQVPFKVEQMLVVGCCNHDPGKAVREVCRVGCVGCGLCARKVPEVFSIRDNLAGIDYDHYQDEENVALAQEKCPMESLLRLGKPQPHHERALEKLEPVTVSGRPAPPERPTPEDMNWRG